MLFQTPKLENQICNENKIKSKLKKDLIYCIFSVPRISQRVCGSILTQITLQTWTDIVWSYSKFNLDLHAVTVWCRFVVHAQYQCPTVKTFFSLQNHICTITKGYAYRIVATATKLYLLMEHIINPQVLKMIKKKESDKNIIKIHGLESKTLCV